MYVPVSPAVSQVVEFRKATSLTGYGDMLCWAIYDLLTCSIHTPNKGSAPEKEVTHSGQDFSPYWQPVHDVTNLECCQKLSEWWGYRKGLQGPGVLAV